MPYRIAVVAMPDRAVLNLDSKEAVPPTGALSPAKAGSVDIGSELTARRATPQCIAAKPHGNQCALGSRFSFVL